jgi:protoheme IX farnesyltransferase
MALASRQPQSLIHMFPVGQYLELCKPKVVVLIVFTAIIGMFLSVPGFPPLENLIAGTIGIALAASSAAAVNHLLDERIDAIMQRTRDRPLPTGQLQKIQVITFAVILAVVSMSVLVLWTNTLTAILTFLSLIGYAIIYTAWLKRATPQNIVIGGAAGAAPPVLGWVAITGVVDPNSLLLFLIIFVWTPPHFWALAIHRRHDYAAAGLPMLPVTHGVTYTRWHILFYTILLVIVTTMPYLTGLSGLLYLAGVSVLNVGFLWYSLRLLRNDDDEQLPMQTFGYSVIYLTMLFLFLLLDHYVPVIIS